MTELAEICSDQRLPLLLGGDFNLLRFASEKNKELRKNRHNDLFNSVINLYELREIVMTGGLFTWSNNQVNPTLEKLDRVLVSKGWEDLFPLALVHKITKNCSDHCPLILSLNNERVKPPSTFRYELFWEQEVDFLDRVKKAWLLPVRGKDALSCFIFKLKNVKNSLKGWGINLRGFQLKRKKEILEILKDLEIVEEIHGLSNLQNEQRADLQKELMLLYDVDELYWFSRSNEN